AYLNTGLLSITDEEGLAFLDKILESRQIPVLLPAMVEQSRFEAGALMQSELTTSVVQEQRREKNSLENSPRRFENPGDSVPGLEVDATDNLHLTAFLKQLFETELKLKPGQMDERTPYADYGADSILLAQILQKIKQKLA